MGTAYSLKMTDIIVGMFNRPLLDRKRAQPELFLVCFKVIYREYKCYERVMFF